MISGFLDVLLCPFLQLPVKDIFGVIWLFILHLGCLAPKPTFYKPNLHVLVDLLLHHQPNVALMVQLIHELHQRTLPQQLVAHLILDVSDDAEEISNIDLWVSQDIPKGVG